MALPQCLQITPGLEINGNHSPNSMRLQLLFEVRQHIEALLRLRLISGNGLNLDRLFVPCDGFVQNRAICILRFTRLGQADELPNPQAPLPRAVHPPCRLFETKGPPLDGPLGRHPRSST